MRSGLYLSGAGLLAWGFATVAAAQGGDSPLSGGSIYWNAPTIQEILAQEKACEAKKPQRKGSGTIGELTYRRMERIITAIGKGEYADSEQKLKEMDNDASGAYEKAVIQQTLAYVYAMQERHAPAIKAYEAALATNALPQQAHEQMLLNVANLHLAMDQNDKGVQVLNRYMQESCNPAPEAHILLAMMYAERKEWRDSLKHTDVALVKAKSPKETWLQLKLALHHELREIARCAEVLVHLIALAPMKESYYKQLYGILSDIKKEPAALAVLTLAERRGFIDEEPEYRSLADMYMYMSIPLRAAHLLERGLAEKKVEANEKNLERLANAWFAAREYEKAEAAMARAAQASGKGELFKQLASIQIEDENWKGALQSLQKAQQKGGGKNPGEVQFLIGVVATQLKQWETAETALRAAMQHEKYVKPATEWLKHMREEYAYNNPSNGNGAAGSTNPQTN